MCKILPLSKVLCSVPGFDMQMQTSMGQAASSLSSLLDMPSEVTDGDREKNLEKSLLQARKELTDAVSSAGDHGPAVTKLLHLQCPIALKYAQLSVGQMLKENCEVRLLLFETSSSIHE